MTRQDEKVRRTMRMANENIRGKKAASATISIALAACLAFAGAPAAIAADGSEHENLAGGGAFNR